MKVLKILLVFFLCLWPLSVNVQGYNPGEWAGVRVIGGVSIPSVVDGDFLVGSAPGVLSIESGATARTSIGLGIGDSSTFSGLTIGTGTKHDGWVVRDTSEVQTTDATVTTLDFFTLLDENTYHVEAYVVAVQSDGTDRASYHIGCTVYRTAAGSATLQGTATLLHIQESNALADATCTVSGNDVRISWTGIAAETWEAGVTMLSMNMSN